jgi:hypothetical protein
LPGFACKVLPRSRKANGKAGGRGANLLKPEAKVNHPYPVVHSLSGARRKGRPRAAEILEHALNMMTKRRLKAVILLWKDIDISAL